MSPTLCNDPSAPTTISEGAAWVPTQALYRRDLPSLDDQLAEATPENAELLKWEARATNQPLSIIPI